jgi:hypothetical protein
MFYNRPIQSERKTLPPPHALGLNTAGYRVPPCQLPYLVYAAPK